MGEVEEDGEGLQVQDKVATTGGEIKQNLPKLSSEVFKWVWLKSSASEAKPDLEYLCVILKAYNYILAPQLS